MQNDAENIAVEAGTGAKEPRFYGKTLEACKLIVDHGVEPKTALILTTGNGNPHPETVRRLKDKSRKYALSSPKMVKLAHQAVTDVLQGKTFTLDQQKVTKDGDVIDYKETISPTYTNKLAAAAMVADRAEPVVRANLNINAEVETPVDLDALRGLFNR